MRPARPPRRAAAALAALALLAWPALAGVPAGVPIARVKTTQRVVALSFDDGPQATPVLDTLLAVLARHDAHATFFVIGRELAAAPQVGAKLLAAGHELGDHTWTHPRLDSISTDSMRVELARTDSLLKALGQRGRPLVRPPYGAFDDRMLADLKRRHRTVALFDVDPSYDFPTLSSRDSIVAKTVDWLGPGSILVMHPWYSPADSAVTMVEPIVAWLERLGYRVVTVSELLKTKHAVVEPSLYHKAE